MKNDRVPPPSELDVADFDDGAEESNSPSKHLIPFKPGCSGSADADHTPKPIDERVAEHYGIPADLVNEGGPKWGQRAKILQPFALKMFCDHYPLTFIHRALGLNMKTLRSWRDGDGWELKRQAVEQNYVNGIVAARLVKTAKITCDAIDIIGKVLRDTKAERGLTLRDAEAVSRILSNLDKIVRLSTGAPTEITESRDGSKLRLPRNAEELAKALSGDPFIVDITPKKSEDEPTS